MEPLRKYCLIFCLIILSFVGYSCNENVVNVSENYPSLLNGEWIITESLSTNGPVCYFIDKGNSVSFEVLSDENGLYFNYFTGSINRHDYFQYNVDGKILNCSGDYSTNTVPGAINDTLLQQLLEIEFLDRSNIHCKLKLAVKDQRTGEINLGDVSNFYAEKAKNNN